MSLLYLTVSPSYFSAYFIFFSALIVTIRSDIESMLISQLVTLFLIPVAFVCSYLGLLPISLHESLVSAFVGFGSLFLIASIFYWIAKKEGLGRGDMELFAFIGSFIGLLGLWATLLFASITGTCFGIVYIFWNNKNKNVRIPFGPFLAAGAMMFVLCKPLVLSLLTLYS